jgi:hypothetical protein
MTEYDFSGTFAGALEYLSNVLGRGIEELREAFRVFNQKLGEETHRPYTTYPNIDDDCRTTIVLLDDNRTYRVEPAKRIARDVSVIENPSKMTGREDRDKYVIFIRRAEELLSPPDCGRSAIPRLPFRTTHGWESRKGGK